jgi:hypothetical protein
MIMLFYGLCFLYNTTRLSPSNIIMSVGIGSRVTIFVLLILFKIECSIVYTSVLYSRYYTNPADSIVTAPTIVTISKMECPYQSLCNVYNDRIFKENNSKFL